MLAAVTAVAVVAFVVTTWLLTIASHAASGTDRANARLDAVRIGLAAGAGAGAAVGLMLAFRRQHHQEISTVWTDHDAAERRITELYTKAVEQLGNDKAPVRLGGLYALERLAQDNPEQRQTIVNVICAYLRMPFPSTAPISNAVPAVAEDTGEPAPETKTETETADDTWRQEKQVRLTAQRILSEHLRRDPAADQYSAEPSRTRFWPGLRLDLTGATLIDFSLNNCVIGGAGFGGATFSGTALFGGATFNGDTWFDRATFNSLAGFDRATFNGDAGFSEATFNDEARFSEATFNDDARFYRATFNDAWFSEATFNSLAGFDRATFNDAWFSGATFSGTALFGGATFSGPAWFDRATFNSLAGFDEATFNGRAGFDRATFNGDARFSEATFNGGAWFREATFSGGAGFDRATFNNDARFSEATFSSGAHALSFARAQVHSPNGRHVWPTGWRLGQDDRGRHTVVLEQTGPHDQACH